MAFVGALAAPGAASLPRGARPSGAPIKVAAFIVVTGPLASHQGDSVDVLEAWAKDTNRKGGIAGHPVEVVVTDTRGDQSTAAAAAAEVASDPSFVAALINDPFAEAAIAKPLSDAGVPVIGGAGFAPTVWGSAKNKFVSFEPLPNVFGITTAFPAVLFEIPIAAEKAGLKNIAGVDLAETATSKLATQLLQNVAGVAGLNFVGAVTVSATQPDFTAECLRLVNERADFVSLHGPGAVTALRIVSECRTQGYSGYFGSSAGAVEPAFYKKVGDAKLTGGLTSFPWFVNAAPVKHYRRVLKTNGVSNDKIGNPSSTAAWATMELFKKTLDTNAAQLDKTVTRRNVLDAYYTIKNETLGGLLPGPVTYTAGQPAPAPQCFWLYTYKGGKFAGNFKPTCPGPEWDGVYK
jgi:branched-chain amino acid transport system substrate-binding protein